MAELPILEFEDKILETVEANRRDWLGQGAPSSSDYCTGYKVWNHRHHSASSSRRRLCCQ
ncbi:uncharacterized protein A4U43_C02F10080, partial [Asparagus officinalis]